MLNVLLIFIAKLPCSIYVFCIVRANVAFLHNFWYVLICLVTSCDHLWPKMCSAYRSLAGVSARQWCLPTKLNSWKGRSQNVRLFLSVPLWLSLRSFSKSLLIVFNDLQQKVCIDRFRDTVSWFDIASVRKPTCTQFWIVLACSGSKKSRLLSDFTFEGQRRTYEGRVEGYSTGNVWFHRSVISHDK